MAGVSGGHLAAEVTRAGGLGFIAADHLNNVSALESEIKIFNKVGGQYSSSETSQNYIDEETKQIRLIDDTIYAQPNQIYQVRFPEKDIKVRIKTLKNVDFS